MFKNRKFIMYTLRHKMAYLKVEKQLLGKNTLSGYLHDLDKVFLYLIFSKQTAHNIHTRFARHHHRMASTRNHFIQMIIDWECARITKPDKPLNAHDTLYKFYPNLEDKIYPLLVELKLI